MTKFLEFMFQNIWYFLGCLILLQGIGELILKMWRIAFRNGVKQDK